MSDLFCVTNRKLCCEDFLTRMEKIAACRPAGIILREKDLPPEAYRLLAEAVMRICAQYAVACIVHSFVPVAAVLHAEAVHLTLPQLRKTPETQKALFRRIGASCHSVADALEAQSLGCSYITAGHIFETDCKKGLPGRGLAFVQAVSDAVSIPVYAIGGIGPENVSRVRAAGAAGICLMSSLMRCPDIPGLMRAMEGKP